MQKLKFAVGIFLVVFLAVFIISSYNDLMGENKNSTTEAVNVNNPVNLPGKNGSNSEGSAVNPLTGEKGFDSKAAGKRPVAIMINNQTSARPQYGISDADIIYELPVEGGITRLMAVYADCTKIPKVCSIRSCRYYFPKISQAHDAIYVHWGFDSKKAEPTLNALQTDRIDGYTRSLGSSFFERDKELLKTRALEHTGFITGENIMKAIEKLNYRTYLVKSKNRPAFHFNSPGSPVVPDGASCSKAVLTTSKNFYSTFSYNAEEKVYYKDNGSEKHIDANNGKQLTFTNVIVLKTVIRKLYPDLPLMSVALEGGTGYYLSQGKYINIKWSKKSDDDLIELADGEGKTLKINAGKSYIYFIGDDKNADLS